MLTLNRQRKVNKLILYKGGGVDVSYTQWVWQNKYTFTTSWNMLCRVGDILLLLGLCVMLAASSGTATAHANRALDECLSGARIFSERVVTPVATSHGAHYSRVLQKKKKKYSDKTKETKIQHWTKQTAANILSSTWLVDGEKIFFNRRESRRS